MLRIVTLSDTHTFGSQIEVPDGDVLIHAGDHSFKGNEAELTPSFEWLESLPHKHKIVIAGNHDWLFDPNAPQKFRGWDLTKTISVEDFLAKFPSITYLCDSSTEVEGLKVYGTPWQPWYYDWAFNFPLNWPMKFSQYDPTDGQRDEKAAEAKWALIPEDTQILVTHTPPQGILDHSFDAPNKKGCPMLRKRVNTLPNLKLHVFGHIHEGFGRQDFQDTETGDLITFVNAANNDSRYNPVNKPIVVYLDVA